MEREIIEIADKYLGMKPNDVGCETWPAMSFMFKNEVRKLIYKELAKSLEQVAEKSRIKMFDNVAPTPYELEEYILSLKPIN